MRSPGARSAGPRRARWYTAAPRLLASSVHAATGRPSPSGRAEHHGRQRQFRAAPPPNARVSMRRSTMKNPVHRRCAHSEVGADLGGAVIGPVNSSACGRPELGPGSAISCMSRARRPGCPRTVEDQPEGPGPPVREREGPALLGCQPISRAIQDRCRVLRRAPGGCSGEGHRRLGTPGALCDGPRSSGASTQDLRATVPYGLFARGRGLWRLEASPPLGAGAASRRGPAPPPRRVRSASCSGGKSTATPAPQGTDACTDRPARRVREALKGLSRRPI